MVMTYVGWPVEEFKAFRSDVEGNFLRTLDLAGDLGERVRAGRRAERFGGSPDLPNFFRKPYGPGWALVGDAGLVMDPITGQGIGDRAAIPIYDFTSVLASFAPPAAEAVKLFEALAQQPAEVDRFLGAITGSTPFNEYFSPANLLRVIGVRAMAGIMLGKLFSGRTRAGVATP
jgi:hypothetical protein